jgi:uncharacterized phage-associated protein
MPYRAVAVANEFLKLPGAAGRLTQMHLQKLTYIAHGWNWAINGEPLVADDVEAWSFGPVIRDLYDHTKFFGKEPIGRQITPDDSEVARFFGPGDKSQPPYKAVLTDRERAVIQHVWRRYGNLSAIRLSELTHQPGTPWFQAFQRGKNTVIDDDAIKTHYNELADRAAQNA